MTGIYMPIYKGRWNSQVVAYTLVDRDVYAKLLRTKWYLFETGRGQIIYQKACTYFAPSQRTWLHNYLCETDLEVDHKNLDTLDNRRENLRPATSGQNKQNRRKPIGIYPPQSQFKGVHRQTLADTWIAQIQFNKQPIYLGTYKTELEAAKAYDEAAKKYFGEFARLNFEDRDEGD